VVDRHLALGRAREEVESLEQLRERIDRMVAGEIEDGARILEGDVVQRVVDHVLTQALVPVALQMDDRGQAIEVPTGRVELESPQLIGVELQGEVLDLVVAAQGAGGYRPVAAGSLRRRNAGIRSRDRGANRSHRRGEGMAESLGVDAGAGLKALGINCTLKKSHVGPDAE